jgi:Tfp pilus assembly protein PilF
MSIESNLNRVKILYKNQQFIESIEICRRLLKKKPKLFVARRILALSYQAINNVEQATIELEKTLLLKPKDAETLRNLGNIYLGQSQLDIANRYFVKAISSDPTMAVAYSNLATCLQRTGETALAEKNYKKAILLGDKTANVYLNLGALHTERGDFDSAANLLVKSMELDPSQSSVYFYTYALMMHLHRYQDALEIADIGLLSNVLSDIELCELLVGKAILFWLFDNVLEAEQALLLSEGVYSDQSNYRNIKNLKVFHRYLKQLVQFRLTTPDFYQNQNQKQNQNKIYFISESHGFSPCGATIEYQGGAYQVRSLFMLGAKIFHLINEQQNKHKASLVHLLEGLPNKSKVVLGFGEIDCRHNEGIFMHCLKTGQDFNHVINEMVEQYLAMLQQLVQPNELELIIYGVPAPHPFNFSGLELALQEQFKAVIAYLNDCLRNRCQQLDIAFLDVYKITNHDGVSNLIYHIDEIHVKPEAIKILFNNIDK